MRFQKSALSVMGFGLAVSAAMGQQAAGTQAPAGPQTVIRAEKKLVLVDTVVTDKKGNYIHDLTVKDFRVWEDKKEQKVETFSFEADPAAAAKQQHYLILFFDGASMQFTDQIQARQAAVKFVEANAGPNRLMAVVNFTGSLQVAQNFTNDAERLKQVVGGTKFSAVSTNPEFASLGGPSLSRAAADFGARDVLLALRSLAKNLSSVPGRKTLIFLSAGFALDSELRSELTAVIDVCNKSNVAVYPIDVRGLVAPVASNEIRPQGETRRSAPRLVQAAYFAPQHGGSPGGGGGGHPGGGGSSAGSAGSSGGGSRGGSSGGTGSRGGGTGGGRSGGTTGGRGGGGNVPGGGVTGRPFGANNPFNQPRQIIPQIPDVSSQQEVLYVLASGTGGFVIVNTNDLLGGLQKIGNEQNEYYVLGYSPSEDSKEGVCHELKVKVERGGTNVRSRSGYCTPKPVDLLAGTVEERELENRASSATSGNVNASMELPYFYTSPNTARVDVAMEIPAASLTFEKEKGKLRSEVNVLGLAYAPDGSVAARFSDTVKLEFDNKKEVKAFQEQPMHYDTQFDVASGKYDLKVVFSSGSESFGKLQMPLAVDLYDSKKFGLSAVALSKDLHRVSDLDVGLDAALLQDKTPLVSKGMQLTPSGSNAFKKTDPAALYVEIYEPLLLEQNAPKIGLQLRILDRKGGQQKLDTGFINLADFSRAGNPVIPVGLRLPLETLAAGSYRAELKAIDTAGNASVIRAADFEVQ